MQNTKRFKKNWSERHIFITIVTLVIVFFLLSQNEMHICLLNFVYGHRFWYFCFIYFDRSRFSRIIPSNKSSYMS